MFLFNKFEFLYSTFVRDCSLNFASMETREILTLQFGNYSNYFGAHFWNLQEKSFVYEPNQVPTPINHDVLYREGINLKVGRNFLIN